MPYPYIYSKPGALHLAVMLCLVISQAASSEPLSCVNVLAGLNSEPTNQGQVTLKRNNAESLLRSLAQLRLSIEDEQRASVAGQSLPLTRSLAKEYSFKLEEARALGLPVDQLPAIVLRLRNELANGRDREVRREEHAEAAETDFLPYRLKQHFGDSNVEKILSFDGELVVTKTINAKIARFNFRTGREIDSYQMPGGFGISLSDAISSDGLKAITLWKGSAIDPMLWNVPQSKSIAITAIGGDQIHGASFSDDGRFLVLGDSTGSAYIIDSVSGDVISDIKLGVRDALRLVLRGRPTKTRYPDNSVLRPVLSPDGKTLLLSDGDGRLTAWDVDRRRIKKVFKSKQSFIPSQPSFSPDGKFALIISIDLMGHQRASQVELWPVDSRDPSLLLQGSSDLRQVISSADSRHVVGIGVKTIYVWETTSGKLVFEHTYPDQVDKIAISSDTSRLAVSLLGKTIDVWNLNTRELTWAMNTKNRYPDRIAFAADSYDILVSYPNEIDTYSQNPGNQ